MEWTDGKYGFSTLNLGGQLHVTVGWDSLKPKGSPETTGYKVTFAGYTLKARPHTLNDAKAAGEAFARSVLKFALNKLEAL